MIAFGSKEHAATRRRPVSSPDGVVHMKSEWMQTGSDPVLSPTVFLIEQPPNTVTPVHFHRQNQFQLFITGSGTIGHHPIRPITVHYAGAYTGYGPLVSGPEGLQYLTLRPVLDTGALFIPEDRKELRKGPKRGGQGGPVQIIAESDLRKLPQAQSTTLMAATVDGLSAGLMNLPPHAAADIARGGPAQGCFAVVVAGTARCDGRELGLWESVFVSSDEGGYTLSAGESGLAVALLYVPVKHSAYT